MLPDTHFKQQIWNQVAEDVNRNFNGTIEEIDNNFREYHRRQDVLNKNLLEKMAQSTTPEEIDAALKNYQQIHHLTFHETLTQPQILRQQIAELQTIARRSQLNICNHSETFQKTLSSQNSRCVYHQSSISGMTQHRASQALTSLEAKLNEWVEKERAALPSHEQLLSVDKRIHVVIEEFREKANQSFGDFKNYISKILQDIEEGKVVDEMRIANGQFVAKLVEQVAKRYFETTRQLAEFEILHKKSVLQHHENILSRFYELRLRSLEIMHKEVRSLQTQLTHEKKAAALLRCQALREQDLELNKILKLEILEDENLKDLLGL